MTRIFLSHSSQDNPGAFALAQWLRENGWQDVFLDRIPRQGIAAGEDWKARIHEAMDGSVAGIFLISRGWMDSTWCQTELTLAYSLNKLIFGVVVDDLPRDEVPELLKSNWQLVDLQGGRDHDLHDVTYGDGTTGQATLSRSGLANLKEGLHRARIAPEHFTWPPEDEPDRAPWRGLSPMEPEDAGIFFGREAQTVRALDAIRALRDSNPPRLLAIVGASGAGKSSFLRAGLIPRLCRDGRNYLTLDPIRPEGGALDAFAKSLTETAKQKTPRALGDIRRLVHSAAANESEALSQFLSELAQAHRLPAFDDQPPPVPTIILPIDQGEELFQSSGRAQGGPFLSLLSHLLHQDSPRFLALITIRSDSYEALQNAPQLSGLNHSTLSLPAIAKGEYSRIITGPIDKLQSAGRKMAFDPAITDTMLAEFDKGLGRDALPLLAFTLDRLYRDYSGAAKITLDDYKAMGGIAGSIDAAVERALQIAARQQSTPNDPLAQQTLLRRTMIPWFAGIDPETGTARRNVSARDQLPPETLPLVDALIDQRLLISDGKVIEPAHEALLREWHALNGWLVADREKLTTLEALRRAAADWQAKGRHKDYLAHKAGRLDEAEQLAERPDLWQQLGPNDRAYLTACRAAVKRGGVLRRAVAAAFLVVVGSGVVATGYQARVASQQAEIAAERDQAAQLAETEARTQAELAHRAEVEARTQSAQAAQSRADALVTLALARAETDPVSALKLVLGAWPQDEGERFPTPSVAFQAISTALANARPHILLGEHESSVSSVIFSPDGRRVVSASEDGTLRLWDAESGAALSEPLSIHEGAVTGTVFSSDSNKIISSGIDGSIRAWDINSGNVQSYVSSESRRAIWSIALFPDNNRLAVATDYGYKIYEISTNSWRSEAAYRPDSLLRHIFLSSSNDTVISSSRFGAISIWDADTARRQRIFRSDHIGPMAVLAEAEIVALTDSRGNLHVFDIENGEITQTIQAHIGEIRGLTISRDARYLVSSGQDGFLRTWEIRNRVIYPLSATNYSKQLTSLSFSPEGNRFASGDEDGNVVLWDFPRVSPTTRMEMSDQGMIQSVWLDTFSERVISGGRDGSLRVWDLSTGAELVSVLNAHLGSVTGVSILPGSDWILSAGDDGRLRVWNTTTKLLESDVSSGFTSISLSSDGRQVVAIDGTGDVSRWLLNDLTTLGDSMRRREQRAASAHHFENDRHIAIGYNDGTIGVWDSDSSNQLYVFPQRHEGWVDSVAVSPNGRYLVSGGSDRTVRIWDIATREALGEPLRGHIRRVNQVAFTPDSRRVVSGDVSGVLRMWDTATGAALGNAHLGHSSHLLYIAFSPDGRSIVSVGFDGLVNEWPTPPPGNILQVACRYLPHINGRPDTSTDGLAAEIGIDGLTLPEDCDTYDPPLPPEFRR